MSVGNFQGRNREFSKREHPRQRGIQVTPAKFQPSISARATSFMVNTMKARFLRLAVAAFLALTVVPLTPAQAPDTPAVTQDGPEGSRRGPQGRMRGAFGKITAIQSDSIEIAGQDGTKSSFKLTSSTEFRKDRQAAKIGDFKVGDMVIVRTDPDSGNATGSTALMVAAAPQGFTGRGSGGQGGAAFMQGTLGKDYVVGEVKSVDPPKLTVSRVDNVTQTLELNEDTSIRRGRDSITMADIQVGDHIIARGAMANDAFVPKSVNVIPPEMWQRLQEMNPEGGAPGATPKAGAPPPAQQKPPEQPN